MEGPAEVKGPEAKGYGDITVKPRLVEKHIKTPATPIRTRLDAHNMPHASTSYLGMRDSSGAGRVFQLDELVGRIRCMGLNFGSGMASESLINLL